VKEILVTQTTLMRVASQELGDSTKWVEIARLNGIVDPFIKGTTRLRLPNASNPSTGGVPQ
jgi:FtsP/CotA-like multicopper oxidase with cupredoxin domain